MSPASQSIRRIRPHAEQAAALLKAMANEQRLMILCQLLDGTRSVGQLNEQLELSQSALSQHLAVLREARVVSTTRDAQTIRYQLSSATVTGIIRLLYKEFCSG